MAHLIRMPRAAWRRQPQGGVSIHRGNPLTAALVDAWLPHQWGVNRVWPKNRLATVYQAGQDGQLAINPQNISSGTTGIEYFHPPCTLYARNTVVASWGGGIVNLAGSTGDGDSIGFAATPYQYSFSLQRNYTGISALTTALGGSHTVGARHHLLARSLSNTFHEFTATNIKTGASSYRTATTDTSAIVFQDLGTVSFGYSGRLAPSLFVVWNRALDDAEIRALYQNPWQLFKPRPSRFILIPSGGAGAVLTSAATAATAATGALTTQIPLVAAAVSIATATGALVTALPLAGSSASATVANGVLTAQIQLSGAAWASMAATGALTTQIQLSGAALAQALASAGLTTTPSGLTGEATAQAAATGGLTTAIPLVGSATAVACSSGALTTWIRLYGVAAQVSAATGDLTLTAGTVLSGAAWAEATAGGALTTTIRLDAQALAQAAASGLLAIGTPWTPARCRTVAAAAAPRRLTAPGAPRRLTLPAPSRSL
jgi:hypothetical protein